MHKLLIETELPRLRTLGYEVFCPNNFFLNTEHQSGSNGWSDTQQTSLPRPIFLELSKFDFFNQRITSRIAQLLNEYFSTVIVTIDPAWLMDIVRVFDGKILFRTYGHVVKMSDYLFKNGAMRAIIEKDNFWYLPHSVEAANQEHSWLRERMKVVPYCLGKESLANLNSWDPKINEIMISCPNLANPFYKDHFKYLKNYFSDSYFKYYGVQTSQVSDANLVGTLSFPALMQKFRNSKGFLYTYKSPLVCFLPPIEMLVTGGPVVFFRGSLLDRYFQNEPAPGCIQNEKEAKILCQRLLKNDRDIIDPILRSQEKIRLRYLPEFVWPIFDQSFNEILPANRTNSGQKKIVNLSEYKSMVINNSDKIVVANASSFLVRKNSQAEPVYSPLVESTINYLKENAKGGGKRILFVRSRKVPFWLGVLKNSWFDLMVCMDIEYPAKSKGKIIEPDRSQSKLRRVLMNPRWAMEKIRKKLLKKGRCLLGAKKFHAPTPDFKEMDVWNVTIFSKRPLISKRK